MAIGISLLVAWCEYQGTFAGLEGKIQDAVWLRNKRPLDASHSVIFEIDDDAYEKCFEETSPLNAQVLMQIVDRIAEGSHAAVLGVDVRTDARKYVKPYRTYAKQRSQGGTPVVWIAGAKNAQMRMKNFLQFLGGSEDEVLIQPTTVLGFDTGHLEGLSFMWGPAVFQTEQDAELRRFPQYAHLLAASGSPEKPDCKPSWAKVLADRYCKAQPCENSRPQAPEVFLRTGQQLPPRYSILEFSACENESIRFPRERQRILQEAEGKVALLGGTFADSGDFHRTPHGVDAGIFVNARAVEASITGDAPRELPQPQSFLLDILTGCGTVLFFALLKRVGLEPRHARMMMLASIVVTAIILAALFATGFIFSIAAVLVGTVIQQLVDFGRENPEILEHSRKLHTSQQSPQG